MTNFLRDSSIDTVSIGRILSAENIPYFIFFIVFLGMPFIYFPPDIFAHRGFIEFMMPAVCAIFLTGIIFLSKDSLNYFFRKKYLVLLFSIYILLISFHFFKSYEIQTYRDFFNPLFLIILPIFAAGYFRQARKFLIVLFCVLWFLTILNGMLEENAMGLPANINWNALLLFISTPILVYTVLRLETENKFIKFCKLVLITLIISLSIYFFLLTESRAVSLAIIFIGALFLFLELKNWRQKKIFLGFLLFSGLSISVFVSIYGVDFLANLIREDARVHLWEQISGLITEHPFIGVGESNLESEQAEFRTVGYSLSGKAADRNRYPHNYILYILASYGIIGLIFFIILFAVPWIYFVLRYKDSDIYDKLLFLGYNAVLFHSLLDIPQHIFPGKYYFLMILAYFIGKYWPEKTSDINHSVSEKTMSLCRIFGISLIIVSFYTGYSRFMASWYMRKGYMALRDEKKIDAMVFYNQSCKYQRVARNLNAAGVTATYKLKNPFLGLKYFKIMKNETPYYNYGHINSHIGVSYAQMEKLNEAVKYFLKEQRNFPLSTKNWHNLYKAYKALGKKKQSEICYDKLVETMEIKGLPMKLLPKVLKNKNYDMNPENLLKLNKSETCREAEE